MERTQPKAGAITEALRTELDRKSPLTPEEERVLRMTHGLGVAGDAALARLGAEGSELADELLVLELQLARQARARLPRLPSPAKSKIVRTLRGRR